MENKKTKIVAPWMEYANQIEAMFKKDPDVRFEYDVAERVVTLRVKGNDKAEAIESILPEEKEFGNITVTIKVLPANEEMTVADTFRRAFAENPIVSDFVTVETLWGMINFLVFKPEVVQYYNDNMLDLNGIKTTVYQDLAKELFGDNDGIFFCTEKVEN